MRRALSILLMVVMVLAPCAVVHAASMKSTPHTVTTLGDSHDQHVDCHSGQQDTSHSVCSTDCNTLQRAVERGMPERTVSEFKASYPALVFALNFVLITLVAENAPDIGDGNLDSISGSKAVLRQTARLRL